MTNKLAPLITHEDPYNVHKSLGIMAVMNFIYRYGFILPTTGGLGYDEYTIFNSITIFIHVMLSCSSLIFRVLRRRMPRKPLIIYKEYQLHTILFTLRSTMFYIVGSIATPSNYSWVLGLLFLHIAADVVSYYHGTPGITTVRVADNSRNSPIFVIRRLFGLYQITSIASMICAIVIGDQGTMNCMGYNGLVAIQSSTFLMTLVRKNIIHPYTHLGIYGMCLLFSTWYMINVNGWKLIPISCILFGGRMIGINKYILWNMFFIYTNGIDRVNTGWLFEIIDNMKGIGADCNNFMTDNNTKFHFPIA